VRRRCIYRAQLRPVAQIRIKFPNGGQSLVCRDSCRQSEQKSIMNWIVAKQMTRQHIHQLRTILIDTTSSHLHPICIPQPTHHHHHHHHHRNLHRGIDTLAKHRKRSARVAFFVCRRDERLIDCDDSTQNNIDSFRNSHKPTAAAKEQRGSNRAARRVCMRAAWRSSTCLSAPARVCRVGCRLCVCVCVCVCVCAQANDGEMPNTRPIRRCVYVCAISRCL
jgi:hypothetical protein